MGWPVSYNSVHVQDTAGMSPCVWLMKVLRVGEHPADAAERGDERGGGLRQGGE